jgi:hypothetical protein
MCCCRRARLVTVSLLAALRDPDVYAEPDVFDILSRRSSALASGVWRRRPSLRGRGAGAGGNGRGACGDCAAWRRTRRKRGQNPNSPPARSARSTRCAWLSRNPDPDKCRLSRKPSRRRTASPAFLNAIEDERKRADAKAIDKLLRAASGEKPVLWGASIVGYGQYEAALRAVADHRLCAAQGQSGGLHDGRLRATRRAARPGWASTSSASRACI